MRIVAVVMLLALSGAALPGFAEEFTVIAPTTVTNGGNTVDGDDTLTIDDTASIVTAGSSAIVTTGDNNTIINRGLVSSDVNAVDPNGDGVTITIINHGTIRSDADAIDVQNDDSVDITNYGTISARTYPIDVFNSPSVVVRNFGTIRNDETSSARNVLDLDGDNSAGSAGYVYNAGTITNGAVDAAIYLRDFNEVAVVNSGTLTRVGTPTNNQGLIEVVDAADGLTLHNSGRILALGGGVALEYANDGRSDTYFLDGSVISGSTYFNGSSIENAHFHFGAGVSGRYQFGGFSSSGFVSTPGNQPGDLASINVENGAYVVDGDYLNVVDLSLQNATTRNVVGLLGQLHHRGARTSGGITTSDAIGDGDNWFGVFGYYSDSSDASFAGDYSGAGVGVQRGGQLSNGLDYYLGATALNSDSEADVGFDSTGYGLVAGLSQVKPTGLGWSLDVGVMHLNSERTINDTTVVATGLDSAEEDYLVGYVSPALQFHNVLGFQEMISLRYAAIVQEAQDYAFASTTQRIGSSVAHYVAAEFLKAIELNNGMIFDYGFTIGSTNTSDTDIRVDGLTNTAADHSWGEGEAMVGLTIGQLRSELRRSSEGRTVVSFDWQQTF
ncbi:hypothetical protein J7382_03110 [Shimia sp. R11_0]|uniref:hypothetical protein n=1 Tax=Shimia sp. R11_0 TaxID=2821096 RepID=UPI001ADC9C66|nr:hypothetical protein [Shimia sp. R11_0]MBO9476515.1 hypothetical protein [Shimia sp. R11_0]